MSSGSCCSYDRLDSPTIGSTGFPIGHKETDAVSSQDSFSCTPTSIFQWILVSDTVITPLLKQESYCRKWFGVSGSLKNLTISIMNTLSCLNRESSSAHTALQRYEPHELNLPDITSIAQTNKSFYKSGKLFKSNGRHNQVSHLARSSDKFCNIEIWSSLDFFINKIDSVK